MSNPVEGPEMSEAVACPWCGGVPVAEGAIIECKNRMCRVKPWVHSNSKHKTLLWWNNRFPVRSDPLREFAKWALDEVRQNGVDLYGGDVQEKAVELGLLEPVTMDEPCGDNCVCADADSEFPAICYRDTMLLEEPKHV